MSAWSGLREDQQPAAVAQVAVGRKRRRDRVGDGQGGDVDDVDGRPAAARDEDLRTHRDQAVRVAEAGERLEHCAVRVQCDHPAAAVATAGEHVRIGRVGADGNPAEARQRKGRRVGRHPNVRHRGQRQCRAGSGLDGRSGGCSRNRVPRCHKRRRLGGAGCRRGCQGEDGGGGADGETWRAARSEHPGLLESDGSAGGHQSRCQGRPVGLRLTPPTHHGAWRELCLQTKVLPSSFGDTAGPPLVKRRECPHRGSRGSGWTLQGRLR